MHGIMRAMQLILLLLLALFSFSSGFVPRQHRSSCPSQQCHQTGRGIRLYGYVPPEADPEFRSMVKKSLRRPVQNVTKANITIDAQATLPLPREGDVVIAPGKWKDERILARIRFLQYSASTDSWAAEIIPLKDGKSAGVFTVDKNAKAYTEKVETLQPVRSFFLRSENGYKIAYKKNSTEILLRAPSFQPIPQGFSVPRKAVNTTVLDEDIENYKKLKNRIISNTLKFGAVGAVISTVAFGPDVSLPFFLGSAAGAAYLYLLGRRTDRIGEGVALSKLSSPLPDKIDKLLIDGRLAVPAVAILLLALKNKYVDHETLKAFSLVSKEQFLGFTAGFLSNRLAIFLTEIRAEMRTEDIISFVPGSMAEVYRQAKKLEAANALAAEGKSTVSPSQIVVLTGPKAAGRSSLSSSLISSISKKGSLKAGKGSKLGALKVCKFLTTDTALWQRTPEKYRLVSDQELEDLRGAGKIVYQGEEKGLFGFSAPIALSTDDLLNGSEDPVLIDGTPEVLDAIRKVSGLQFLNIWISLQTKEQFVEKASELVRNEITWIMKSGTRSVTAAQSAEQVSDLINDAARDVTYYMSKAPMFEYTLLNSGSEEESLDELEQLLSNSL